VPLTPHPLTDGLCGLGAPGPWTTVFRTGDPLDVEDLTVLAPAIYNEASAAGFKATWIRPIAVSSGGDVHAALVVWSTLSGRPSPNQEDHLRKGVSIASLAFGQLMLIDKLTHAATHDQLTGVGNRSKLYSSVEAVESQPISVLYLDLDGFKAVNDQFGHDAGDRVLVAVAERIAGALRDHDEVARVGGDEFVVVLRELPDRGVADRVAERITLAVSHPIDVGSRHVSVAVSVGIAHGRPDEQFGELIERADHAMYKAKLSRRQ
jgi:diguanylate cyclase (GGDEF)-like protein